MQNKNDSLPEFFANLGYEVDFDFSRNNQESWYEILLNGKLVCQIDANAPLSAVIEDLSCWHLGKDATSDSNYKVNAPDSKNFDKLLKKVYDSYRSKAVHVNVHLHIIYSVPVFDGYFATDKVFELPYNRGERIYASIQDAELNLGKDNVNIHWNLRDTAKIPVNLFSPQQQ